MKQVLLAVLLIVGLSPSFCHAQTVTVQDTAGFNAQQWRDTCFGLLNLTSSNIPTGYLIDYSLTTLNDSSYNSTLGAPIDTVTSGKFFGLVSIFDRSKVNPSANLLPAADSLFITAYRAKRNSGNIPLMFLYQPYQKINPNGLSTGQFSLTSDSVRIQDVSGRTGTPYIADYFFAFSPFDNDITQYGSLTFNAAASLWNMPGVTSVLVDFGDGAGYQTLTAGSTITVNYSGPGTYMLSAMVYTTAGNFTARSIINYAPPTAYFKADTVITVTATPVYNSISDYVNAHAGSRQFRTMDGGDPCSDGGIFSQANCDINPGATITIVNGCDNYFDKPVIVVEGFDPDGTTTATTLANYINKNALEGPAMVSTLASQGYDIVYVIFTRNTNFIENNAMVLEAVIQKVNQLKNGTAKNTIIGISMGGLVARWALKDMENNTIDHQTLNFFSYDSPQQGANVSFGMQCFFNQIKTDFPEVTFSPDISKLNEAFNSPAAEEMLALNANSNDGTPVMSVRRYFAKDLIDMGYPATNNYGVSLGRGDNPASSTTSGVGNQFSFSPLTKIFHGSLSYIFKAMVADVYSEPNYALGQVMHYQFWGLNNIRTAVSNHRSK